MPRGTHCKQLAQPVVYGAVTHSGGPFQNLRLDLPSQTLRAVPLSLATTGGIFSFPQVTKMFQFTCLPRAWLFDSPRRAWACPHAGFPIRTSPPQSVAHTCAERFAVYRVLLRPLTAQAFTVRPCSFSNRPHRDLVAFAFHLLAIMLLKSARGSSLYPPPQAHSAPTDCAWGERQPPLSTKRPDILSGRALATSRMSTLSLVLDPLAQ